MRRWILSALLMMLLLLVAACGAPPVPPEETPVQEEEGLATVEPTATPAAELPTPTPAAYPAQSASPSAAESGNPEAVSPPTAYPVDMRIWVLRPLGYQCEESDATLEEAVSALTDAGIEVFESETTTLEVTEACGSPTSEHFRAQILRSDYHTAQMLGWFQES